jgi:hypothetical protein
MLEALTQKGKGGKFADDEGDSYKDRYIELQNVILQNMMNPQGKL